MNGEGESLIRFRKRTTDLSARSDSRNGEKKRKIISVRSFIIREMHGRPSINNVGVDDFQGCYFHLARVEKFSRNY